MINRRVDKITSLIRFEIITCLLLWSCLLPNQACGQDHDGKTFTLVLRNVPLGQALEEWANLTEIDLVYSSELTSGKQVFCNGRNLHAEKLLGCLLENSGLDFVRSSSGTYIIIPRIEEAPEHGMLSGSVVDASTGEPLPYANILLADARTGTTTNDAGLFGFSSLVTGPHRIVVTYLGYETAVDSVWITPGSRERLEIELQPQEIHLAPVVIDGITQRLPSSELGLGILNSRDIERVLGSGTPDVARAASTLSGVSVQYPLADLHIQGGASGEHLVLLDGVPIRDPVNLGRHLGAFSPLAIKRLTVHKAGFSVEHGSHLSGVVSVDHNVEGQDSRRFALNADPLSANLKAQIDLPIPGIEKGSMMFALRRSMWDLYQDPGLTDMLQHWGAIDPLITSLWARENAGYTLSGLSRYSPDVSFLDAHGAIRIQLSPFRQLFASVYRAENYIGTELLTSGNSVSYSNNQSSLILTSDDYAWINDAAQISHTWLLDARSIVSFQLRGSRHMSRYTYHALNRLIDRPETLEQLNETGALFRSDLDASVGSNEINRVNEFALETELDRSLSSRHHLEIGLAAGHTSSRFNFGNRFITPFEFEGRTWDFSTFLKGEASLGIQTTIEPGIRLTYLPDRNTVYAEPRIAVRYDGSSRLSGGYALRVAGGLYRQFTNQFELTSYGSSSTIPSMLFWLPVDNSIAPPRSYHLTGEALFMPAPGWDVRLEAYFKEQSRLLTLDYATLLSDYATVRLPPKPVISKQSQFIDPARGRTAGGSIRITRTGALGTVTASYERSYSVRTYPGRFDGKMVPVPWNTPHKMGIDLQAKVHPSITLDVKWSGSWGRSWAFRRAYYDYLALQDIGVNFGPFDMSDPASHVLPSQHFLDAGVTFKYSAGFGNLQIRAHVANILDRKNVYDWSLENYYDQLSTIERTLAGRFPSLSIRFDF